MASPRMPISSLSFVVFGNEERDAVDEDAGLKFGRFDDDTIKVKELPLSGDDCDGDNEEGGEVFTEDVK